MRTSSIFRYVSLVATLSALLCLTLNSAVAQDVGGDVGGGAGAAPEGGGAGGSSSGTGMLPLTKKLRITVNPLTKSVTSKLL